MPALKIWLIADEKTGDETAAQPLGVAYVIRHKPSGHCLPYRKRRAGFTNDDPAPGLPRMFHSAKAARLALHYWLQGEWGESMGEGEFGVGELYPDLKKKRPDRKADEMEVLPVAIVLVAE